MTGRNNAGGRRRASLMAGLAAGALLTAAPMIALAQTAHRIHITAGSLDAALQALAAQTHEQMTYSPALVAGRKAPAVDGDLTTDQALQRLLGDSGLTVRRTGPAAFVLTRVSASASPISTAPVVTQTGTGNVSRPFGGDAPVVPANTTPAELRGAPTPTAPSTVSEVEVTGTHIRGGGAGASPIVVIDHADIERSGQGTLAGVLSLLPQNYGGQDTDATVTTHADRTGANTTFATGVNLRGLGANATLVLVDGRRLGGSGTNGNFADVSTLPTIAVERVEVLLDGASAIYGSDAVAGVVNIILRKDLDGGEIRVRAGGATDGSPDEQEGGVVFGHTWTTGGFLLAYDASHRTALATADRSFSQSADLRPFGGSDFRSSSAFPGNVIAINPATGVSGPFFGIPAGQNGIGLTPGAFHAGVTNLTSPQVGSDILPDQTVQTVYASAHQDLGDRLEVSGDARYGFRATRFESFASTATLSIGRGNPFFVSPNGTASNTIAYSFSGALPNPIARGTAESDSASLGGHLRLDHEWAADGYLAFAQEIDEAKNTGLVNTAILAEALGNVPDNPATAYSPARDGFFNPYAGGGSNPEAVTNAIGSGYTNTRSKTQVESANLQFDGPLFALPGGNAKAAVGANVRRESFLTGGSSFSSAVTPTAAFRIDSDRIVSALYAEALAPLVGPETGVPGVAVLDLSAAVRYEHYSDFGDTVNPKGGITWIPVSDLKVRATYGTSFRAPSFNELLARSIYTPIAFNSGVGSAEVLTLALQGGNPNLKPETAESWTLGIDFTPRWAPGLRLSGSWFDTDFQNRIDKPVLQNTLGALTDPRFVDFRQFISPATNAADLALITGLLNDPAAATAKGLNPPTAYGAIVQLRNVNTGELRVRGLDLQASDHFGLAGGVLSLAGNGTVLFNYDQALTPDATATNLVGLAAEPPRFRARLTADWTRNRLSLGTALNYLSASKDSLGAHIDSLTTVDAQLRYAAGPGALDGTVFALNVRNLFNTDPPFYNNPFGFAYDPSNADPVGRFVSVQITKNW